MTDLHLVSPDDLDRFISLEEAAERLGISTYTAREMVRAKTFPVAVRTLNRIHRVSLRLLTEYINGEDEREADVA